MRLHSLLLSALLLGSPAAALADTMYTYTPASTFTIFNDGDPAATYNTSDSVHISFVLPSPLAPDLTFATNVTPLSYSFSDGLHSFTQALPNTTAHVYLGTDASGNITSWNVSGYDFLGTPGTVPYVIVQTYSISGFSGDVGVLLTGITYSEGQNLGQPGTFSATDLTATPEPSSLILLGTGCFSLCGAVRRRLRRA